MTVVVTLLAGCGGHGAGMDGDGDAVALCSLDRTRRLVDLKAGEVAAFCDCVASLEGGYGHVTACDGGGELRASSNQAACVAGAGIIKSSCTVTVADALGCAAELGQCNFTSPGCQSYLACLPVDGGI